LRHGQGLTTNTTVFVPKERESINLFTFQDGQRTSIIFAIT